MRYKGLKQDKRFIKTRTTTSDSFAVVAFYLKRKEIF